MIVDAKKQNISVSGRGCGKTMMRLAYNQAWILSYMTGEPVELKTDFTLVKIGEDE